MSSLSWQGGQAAEGPTKPAGLEAQYEVNRHLQMEGRSPKLSGIYYLLFSIYLICKAHPLDNG
jgi:hypothetical protein